jgi:mycothiol system anti-sigma-R factor
MKDRCREVLEQAYLYLDEEVLSEEERAQFQVHLEECAPCLEYVGLHKEFVFVTARLRGKTECPDALRARITNLLDEA